MTSLKEWYIPHQIAGITTRRASHKTMEKAFEIYFHDGLKCVNSVGATFQLFACGLKTFVNFTRLFSYYTDTTNLDNTTNCCCLVFDFTVTIDCSYGCRLLL